MQFLLKENPRHTLIKLCVYFEESTWQAKLAAYYLISPKWEMLMSVLSRGWSLGNTSSMLVCGALSSKRAEGGSCLSVARGHFDLRIRILPGDHWDQNAALSYDLDDKEKCGFCWILSMLLKSSLFPA